VDISFHPPPDPEERRSLRAIVPWWRRFTAWLADFHKFVTTLVAVAGTTIAVHVWLKGLITRKELELAVDAAVTKSMAEVKGDLATIKTNTGGLPDWRGETARRLGKAEDKLVEVEKQTDKNERRIDTYIAIQRGSK
jgi:hypothetical protein